MTRLLELLISTVIVAVLFGVVGLLLPSSRSLTESVETNRRQSIVFDTINSLRRFKDWNPVVLRDPGAQLQLSGPDAGVGAKVDYTSKIESIGKGSWEIVESDQDERVLFKLENPQRGSDKRMEFTLTPTGRNNRNIQITQKYDVTYGWNLFGRYAGLYVSRNVGDDVKLGLGKLTSMLASVPNVDYRVEGSKLRDLTTAELPPENLLVVFAGAVERNNQIIKDSMKANIEWIKRTMDANGLEAAGPVRIISTELGRENYTFDVAQPVRKKSGAAAATTTPAEGETAAAPAPVATTTVDDGELTGLELLGPVTYTRTKGGRVAKAAYTGYMAELDNVRSAVRAWAMTQGYEVTDRPYEFYKNGVDEAFTENGEYEVYWTLKQ